MESMSSLSGDLPQQAQLKSAEQALQDAFRQSAISITHLLKAANKTNKKAFNAGYTTGLKDVLDFLQRDLDSKSGQSRIARLIDYIEARQEALRQDAEDGEEERRRSPSPRQSAAQTRLQSPVHHSSAPSSPVHSTTRFNFASASPAPQQLPSLPATRNLRRARSSRSSPYRSADATPSPDNQPSTLPTTGLKRRWNQAIWEPSITPSAYLAPNAPDSADMRLDEVLSSEGEGDKSHMTRTDSGFGEISGISNDSQGQWVIAHGWDEDTERQGGRGVKRVATPSLVQGQQQSPTSQ